MPNRLLGHKLALQVSHRRLQDLLRIRNGERSLS
jgi:hypothetical protein